MEGMAKRRYHYRLNKYWFSNDFLHVNFPPKTCYELFTLLRYFSLSHFVVVASTPSILIEVLDQFNRI